MLKKNDSEIIDFMKQEIYQKYDKCLKVDSLKRLLCNVNTNKDARVILFWIELYRQHISKDYKDRSDLNYIYTLEHLMPQKWQDHWADIAKDDKTVQRLIYQISNMTLVKGKLNTDLQNNTWYKKLMAGKS